MDLESSALVTDLYQLTMLQAYFHEGMEETAVFDFFARKLPPPAAAFSWRLDSNKPWIIWNAATGCALFSSFPQCEL